MPIINKLKSVLLFSLFFISVSCAHAQSNSSIQFTVDRFGLSTLSHNGVSYITSSLARDMSAHHVTGVFFAEENRSLYQDQGSMSKRTLDTDGKGMTLTYGWGTVNVKYEAVGNKLRMIHTVTNTGTSTITRFNIVSARNLKLPGTPTAPGSFDLNNLDSIENVPVGAVTVGSNRLLFAFENVKQNVRLSLGKWYDDWYPLSVQISSTDESPFAIAPGKTYTFVVTYYFGNSSESSPQIAPDIYSAFREAFPMMLSWSDRRPIMMGIYSDHGRQSLTNPRGYQNDPKKDYVMSSTSAVNFRKDMLAAADRTIDVLQTVNAQGVIVWDLEGQLFPHAITYLGDPRRLAEISPEMNALADEFLGKIKNAGFRIGLTLRPQELKYSTVAPTGSCTPNDVTIKYNEPINSTNIWRNLAFMCNGSGVWSQGGLPYFQPDNTNPAQVLIDKITYAKNRWGVTLFYIDSNAFSGKGAYPSDIFERVLRAHPDVLLIPELENPRYGRSTAPYNELDLGFSHAPSAQKNIYPNSFSIINMSDGLTNANIPLLVDSVRQGNILLGRGWFQDSSVVKIKEIYAAALSNAPTPTVPTSSNPPANNPPSTSSGQGNGTVTSYTYSIPTTNQPTQTTNTNGISSYTYGATNQSQTNTNSADTANTASNLSTGTLSIALLGNNPAYLEKGASYRDLGVVVTGGSSDFIFKTSAVVNGKDTFPLEQLALNTSSVGTSTIKYVVTDSTGKKGEISRTVVVFNPNSSSVTYSPVQTNISNTEIMRTLSLGSRGDDVLNLQRILVNAGYISSRDALTGYFGQLTHDAVKKMQCDYGVVCAGSESTTGYGVVGNKTRVILKSLSSGLPVVQNQPVSESNNSSISASSTVSDDEIQNLMNQVMMLLKVVAELQIRLQALKQ